jgi:hypothetical protein
MSRYLWVLRGVGRRVLCSVAVAAWTWVVPGDAAAQPSYDDNKTAEGWVWALVKEGKAADLDARCSQLDATAAAHATNDKPEWKNTCRQLKPAFLVDLLTKTPWRDQLRPVGIAISGAWIEGDVDLAAARLNRPFKLEDSLIEGYVVLEGARTDSDIAFANCRITRPVNAGKLRSEMSLSLAGSKLASVLLGSAKIDGSIEASGVAAEGAFSGQRLQVGVNLQLLRATIAGDVDLLGAKVDGLLNMRGSTVRGEVQMSAMSAGNLYLGSLSDRAAEYHKGLDLIAARIVGDIDLTGATVDGPVHAQSLFAQRLMLNSTATRHASYKTVDFTGSRFSSSVEATGARFEEMLKLNGVEAKNVFLRSTPASPSVFKNVDLTAVRVSQDIDLEGVAVDGALTMNGATAQRVFMRSTNAHRATFKSVDLGGLRTTGVLQMHGSWFDGPLSASNMQIGGDLMMGFGEDNKRKGFNDNIQPTVFRSVVLWGTRVGGQLIMEGSVFREDVSANTLEIGGHFNLSNVLSRQRMDLRFIRVGGNLDASSAMFADLDLAGAYIKADLTLSDQGTGRATGWSKVPPGDLNLRNAQAGNLMDVQQAWPEKDHLHLDGFSFARLGERRTARWWDENWIKLDNQFTPGPYEQIAAALNAAGERSAAEDMRFLGRVRQRETEKDWGSWVVDLFLEYVAGFGIGDHTFRVLYWVIGISGLGGIYLWAAVPAARQKGATWCFGAALSRLLPVIEVNREFTDFFNDPQRERLTGFQSAVFSMVGMLGWLLGAILVAAVAGLTQKG